MDLFPGESYLSSDSPQLAEAKTVFESTCIDQLSDTTAIDTSVFTLNLGSIVPDWSSAVSSTSSDGDYESIDVNISDSKYRYRVYQKDDQGEDVRIVRCDAKIVIVKDVQSNNSSTFVLFYVPSNEYSRSHGGNIAESVTNFRIPESYSGLKIWTRLDGRLIRVNRYSDGYMSDAVSFLNMEGDEDLRVRTECVQRLCQAMTFQRGEEVPVPAAPSSADTDKKGDIEVDGGTLNPSICIGYKDQDLGHIWDPGHEFWPGIDDPIPDPGGHFDDGNIPGGGSGGSGSGSGNGDNYGDLKDDESYTENKPKRRVVSDFIEKTNYIGYSNQNCFAVAKNIVEQYGCTVAGPNDIRNYTFFKEQTINGETKLVKTGDSDVAVSMIINRINDGKPVLVGVHYDDNRGINDGTIDHFLVLYGYGFDADNRLYFDYQDTNRSKLYYDQTHGPNHIFNYDPETGFIKGSHFSNGRKSEMDYYITHIRYSE